MAEDSTNIPLNGFSIISFNVDFDIYSIKYENYEFKNNDVSSVTTTNLNTNLIRSFSLNRDEDIEETTYLGLDQYWILQDDLRNSLIIKREKYLDNIDNLFGGPFDTIDEAFQYLNDFFSDFNYNVIIEQ